MKSILPAPMKPEDLKAAPRQGPRMIMTKSIKIVLWYSALTFFAIVMIISLIPLVLLAGDPFLDRLEEAFRRTYG